MKKYVYLAGPIEKCNNNEIHEWRKYVQNNLEENIVGINPYRGDEKTGNSYSYKVCKSIHDKNLLDSKKCDALLVNIPGYISQRRPSYGTIFEIAWFDFMQKPIVVVSDDEILINHPLIVSSVGWLHNDLDDAIFTINSLLGVY